MEIWQYIWATRLERRARRFKRGGLSFNYLWGSRSTKGVKVGVSVSPMCVPQLFCGVPAKADGIANAGPHMTPALLIRIY